MRFILTRVESAVLRRLQLLKRLQEVTLSPEEGLALIQRLETNSCSAQDCQVLIQMLEARQAFAHLLEASLLPEGSTPERKARSNRQLAKASRRRHRR